MFIKSEGWINCDIFVLWTTMEVLKRCLTFVFGGRNDYKLHIMNSIIFVRIKNKPLKHVDICLYGLQKNTRRGEQPIVNVVNS